MLISLACYALNRAVQIQMVSLTITTDSCFFCHLLCAEFVIVHVKNVFRELEGGMQNCLQLAIRPLNEEIKRISFYQFSSLLKHSDQSLQCKCICMAWTVTVTSPAIY